MGAGGKRWELRPVDAAAAERLARGRGLPDVVARMLVARGHVTPEAAAAHLEASLHSLHEPRLLPGLEAAAARIARACGDGERVLVHGDYDVDGVAGTALLMRLLRLVGARAEWYVPNRFTDGYSFGPHSVARCHEREVGLVVSVDNGTSAVETIAALRGMGVETIVTDHHEPPRGALPEAVAIVNPKLAGSQYPFRELCGAGVAFKLAWGVCQEQSGARRVRADLRAFLVDAMAYVALATVCDVVPLVSENRVLARRGLQALEATQHAGLRALLAVAGLSGVRLFAEDVGFQLGPRLNAAGRLGSAGTAVELLLADDPRQAQPLAEKLDLMNRERRRVEAELCERARVAAEPFRDAARWPVLVVAGAGWHQGVVGVVAARLVREFGRPALVIGLDGEAGRGSARSVPGFDVLAALHGGAELMPRYGGHAQAAGCEVRAADVDALREAVCARARELLGGRTLAEPRLWIDGSLPLEQVTPELMGHLDRLEPFGAANEKPVLHSADVRLSEPPRTIGGDGAHLVLALRRGTATHRALAFGMAARAGELALGIPLELVYTPRWNTFRGERSLELVLHDFRVASAQAEVGFATA
jgi:single-stranded-DNA-specific exonuclease